MCFQDFPFDDSLPSFVHHSDVMKYLKQYAHHYQLYQFISFNTQVMRVTPLHGSTTLIGDCQVCRWEIETCNVLTGKITKDQFDIVLVCNG